MQTHAAARVAARLAEVMWDLGRIEDGLERMNLSFELLSQDEPDADLASLAAQLGRFLFFGGQADLGRQRIEAALEMAENLALPEVLAQALTTKAVILNAVGRRQEGLALLRFALRTAIEHDKPSAGLRASYNLCRSARTVRPLRRGRRRRPRRAGAEPPRRQPLLGALLPRPGLPVRRRRRMGRGAARCSPSFRSTSGSSRAQAFAGAPLVQATIGVHRGTAGRREAHRRPVPDHGDVRRRAGAVGATSAPRRALLLAEGDLREALATAEQRVLRSTPTSASPRSS